MKYDMTTSADIKRKDALIAELRELLATEREKNRQLVEVIRWLERANTQSAS